MPSTLNEFLENALKDRPKVNEGWEMKYQKEVRKWIPKISVAINYDVYAAAAIAYELLTDVNFHEAAEAVHRIAKKDIKKG